MDRRRGFADAGQGVTVTLGKERHAAVNSTPRMVPELIRSLERDKCRC